MVDKEVIQQVLGSLIKCPQLLNEVDKYNLTLSDFSSKFEKYIFSAIHGLYFNGAESIQIIDIENYLSTNPIAKNTFESNNGIEYLQDIEEFSKVENFPYYYDKLKKINLLNDLKKDGFDISDYYSDDLTSDKAIEINERFEELNTKDIINDFKKKLIKLENDYGSPEEVKCENAADDIDNFIETMFEVEDIGLPIQGSIYNQIIDGAQPCALTIRAGGSGVGKTRQAVGDACLLAYPIRFNTDVWKWEQVGSSEKVLFIITEQTFKQIRKMILAYLTGFNESRFKYKDFNEKEMLVIEQAKEIMKKYYDNFIILQIPNPTIELVKAQVRDKCLTNDIGYVFYDYIFIGPSLLGEFRGFNLRNDEVLLMFATALKDLAVELNICMFTSTQVNANADDNKNIRNEGSLAGGRATINKADNGAILARPTKEELDALEPITSTYGIPNMVTDIFKVRSGQWTQVRIWSNVDLGIMRKKDLFLTDSRLEPIEGFFERAEYHIENWDEGEKTEVDRIVDELNEGVISGL